MFEYKGGGFIENPAQQKLLKPILKSVPQDESSPPGSGGKSDSNRSSGGSGGGGEGLMQEMNALLARR